MLTPSAAAAPVCADPGVAAAAAAVPGADDISRFAVELRERHLEYWTPYSETHPRTHNSKRPTYHQWCALPTDRALIVLHPITCFSTCLVMSFAVQLVSDFAFTPHVLRRQHGTKVTPLPVTCLILYPSKMSSMSFPTASIPA